MRNLRYFLTVICLLFTCSVSKGNATKDGGLDLPKTSSDMAAVLPHWLGDGFSTSVTDHFCVAHDAGSGEAAKLAGQLEDAFAHFHLFFEPLGFELHAPGDKLSWISFTDPDCFLRYTLRADKMDLSHLSGYYSSKTNRVAVVRSHGKAFGSELAAEKVVTTDDIVAMAGDQTDNQYVKIAHELAHQLAFNTGLQKRGVMYPLWVSEGLATQYEMELDYCHSTNIARNDRLMQMRAYDRLIPLEELVSVTRLPAEQYLREDLYAQAWGFFGFLLENRPQQLRNYLHTLNNTKPGFRLSAVLDKEFTDSFGSVEILSREWLEFLSGR